MRIFKMLALVLMGLHLSTCTQEEPIYDADENTEQEQTIEEEPTEQEYAEEEPAAQETEEEAVEQPEEVAAEDTPEESASIEPEPAAEETAEPASVETAPAEQAQVAEEQPTEPQTPAAPPAEPQAVESMPIETHAIEIPAVPEPMVEDASMAIDDDSSESPLGIDTVSLEDPQGNWLFKRIWWERAEDRYEKIRQLVDKIWNSRVQFFNKRSELDREILNPFYINSGMTLGELQIILKDQLDLLEKQRDQEGDLTEEEREEFESLAAEQDSLKQLKLDVDSIANLHGAINKALEKLMDQINEANHLETQAWNNFKEIAHILNDTKARELYYMIEGAARNIKSISTYLEQSFLTHFDTLMNETRSHIVRVQNRMQALKEKGVNFKSQAEQIALQQKQEKQQAEEEEAAEQEEENKPKQKTGLINWVLSLFQKAFNFVISIVSMPYNMIFGKK